MATPKIIEITTATGSSCYAYTPTTASTLSAPVSATGQVYPYVAPKRAKAPPWSPPPGALRRRK